MWHGYAFSKLGRDSLLRQRLLKNLATALIKHERITTTLPRAKAMRKIGDKVRPKLPPPPKKTTTYDHICSLCSAATLQMITLGKAGTQEAKSEAWRWMRVCMYGIHDQQPLCTSLLLFRSVRLSPKYLARSENAIRIGRVATLECSGCRIAKVTTPLWLSSN